MRSETESDRRADLRMLGEQLVELTCEDTQVTVETVQSATYASTCAKCRDYGQEVFENITVVSKSDSKASSARF